MPTPDKAGSGLLVAEGVAVEFAGLNGPLTVLEGVDVSLANGEFVCLLGPSGCGKSTLLRVLAGLVHPNAGSVTVDGQPHAGPSGDVGLIFQQSTLFAWLTVRENIEFALKEDQPDTSARRARARELLQLVGLQGFEKERPRALSGGMAQRLALARALATAPRVLLLDEPFGALDAVSRGEMHAVLLRVWSSLGMGVLFVTHDVDEAVVLADRVLIMSRRPTHIVGEYAIDLPRPRVAGGIRCRGFEDRRNEVVRAAHELFSERLS